jgi:hypothetical protein
VSAKPLRPFGIYDAQGALVYLGMHASADDAWQIGLGWPSAEEISAAKSRGLKAIPVNVSEPQS